MENNQESFSLDLYLDGALDTLVNLIANPVEHYETDFTARESVHQTKNGFFVDEWGWAVGHVSLQAVVILDATRKDVLADLNRIRTQSKKTSVDDSTQREVQFHFFSRGDHFSIRILRFKITQGNDRGPSMATIAFEGVILEDLMDTGGNLSEAFDQVNAGEAVA